MYTVLNFNWKPSDFVSLGQKEKAFVIACIDRRINEEQAAMRKARG